MRRRDLLAGAAAFGAGAVLTIRASAPSRAAAAWPSDRAWAQLARRVGGNLLRVRSPLAPCRREPQGAACASAFESLSNPYFIGDDPALTQTSGWLDAWTSSPSVYAVVARHAGDVAAAVDFAREHRVRLVVKGGGHSYQGTSNAPHSLLIWTRRMHAIALHDAFLPNGCGALARPLPAVSVQAGAIWFQIYDAVTTKAGRYVQGGGCTTVGVAGLVSSGGFGSFSKHYGTAASSLLEAEVVTADGKIRTVSACRDPELFWALKGGGGGTFGVITRLTLRTHDLDALWGGANFTVMATSDAAFRRLITRFIEFYRSQLLNDRWGEQAHFTPHNELIISMVFRELRGAEARAIWKPFLDWLAAAPGDYSVKSNPDIGAMPAQHWWDVPWSLEHGRKAFVVDPRPGASPANAWWTGDGGQVGWFVYGFGSLWLPQALLDDDRRARFCDALFAASRRGEVELHFNKGLAGAPPEALAAARDTATNPAVLDAFALAIVADGQGPAFSGIAGHEPDAAAGRIGAANVRASIGALQELVPGGGAYVSESDYFQPDHTAAYWGSNASRLAAVKRRYDPQNLFSVHNGLM